MKKLYFVIPLIIVFFAAKPAQSNHLFWTYFHPMFVPVVISGLTEEEYLDLTAVFAGLEFTQAMFFAEVVRVIARENTVLTPWGQGGRASLIDTQEARFWLFVAQRANWGALRLWPARMTDLVARAVMLNQETYGVRNRFHRIINFLNAVTRSF